MASQAFNVRKVYPVADLIGKDVALIKVIISTIDPHSWQKGPGSVDGPGLITYFPDGKSLVIVTSPDVHAKVAALLSELRAAKAEQETKK